VNDKADSAVREAYGAFTGIIAWIGASVAGFTALCYGAGYFVIHTHLAMLGFSGVVDVPADQLLLEGGRFFYYTLGKILLAGMVIVLIPAGFYLIARSFYHIPIVYRNNGTAYIRRILTSNRLEQIKIYGLPLLAILIVVLHFNYYYDEVGNLQKLTNLAFVPPASEPGLAGQVAPMITSGSEADRDNLIATYLLFVFNYTVFISGLWIVIYRVGETPLGKIAKTFFILYTVLLTASLPLAFGVLVRTPIYPATVVILKNGVQARGLLLRRTEYDILVWKPDVRRAISFKISEVSQVETSADRNIFQKE
jgi:hypothetical protein